MRKSIIFTLAFLVALLLTLAIRAQSPQDYVVMRAWEQVRRADAYVYPSGLVSYWSMDSRSGDDVTVYDTAGTNDLTNDGLVFSSGKYNDAAENDGLNHSTVSADVLRRTAMQMQYPFTFSAWIYLDALEGSGNTSTMFGEYSAGDNNRSLVFDLLSGNPRLVYSTDGIDATAITGTNVYSTLEWTHIALVVDSDGSVYFYKNGAKENAGTMSAQPYAGTAKFCISAYKANSPDNRVFNPIDGKIDEIAIWNRALSSNEVSEIYNNGVGRFYTP